MFLNNTHQQQHSYCATSSPILPQSVYFSQRWMKTSAKIIQKHFVHSAVDGESYRGHSHTGKRQKTMRMKNRNKERRAGTLIYRDPLLSTAQYNRKRCLNLFPFQNKSKSHTLCVFLLYIFTHAQTNKPEGRESGVMLGPRHGLWAITGDTIWVYL